MSDAFKRLKEHISWGRNASALEELRNVKASHEALVKALEEARNAKLVGNSLEAKVSLALPEPLFTVAENYKKQLASILIVSQAEAFVAEEAFLERSNVDLFRRCAKAAKLIKDNLREEGASLLLFPLPLLRFLMTSVFRDKGLTTP